MQQLANRCEAAQALPTPWVKKLFQRFAAMYGDKLPKMWGRVPEDEMHAIWAEDLAGYTGEEISVGLQACKQREWPPTLPEFLRLCRPWMNPEVAYHEAVHGMSCRRRGETGNWSHPAIYWAAVATGTHDLLNSTYGSIKQRWEKSFSDELSKGNWSDIPPVRSALPAPGQTMATKAEAAAALQRMGAAKAFDESGRNPKRWIDKWQQRIKNGERPSPAIAEMLKRAMEEA
ncbi:hypothetical protein [Bordetella bronchiseptica]|uniref:hypothetical protein n=1 Tax=Bordetella bronchiseptica TaxID=518 RepID=UPI00052826FE|nr:hypothetical protein [Bordetella bronchiseptica]